MRWIGQITYDEVSYFREDVIIEADNKLGIGTFSPSEKLHVVGDALITGDSLADTFKPAAAGEPIKFKNFGSTELARITNAGNVGIGTTSPAAALHVYGTTGVVSESPSNASVTIRRNDNTNYSALLKYHTGNSEKWVAGLSDAGDFTDSTGVEYFIGKTKTDPKFLINSSGNVGIGTTSPGRKLTVAGSDNLIFLDSTGNSYLTIDRSATNRRSALVLSTAGDGTSGIPNNINWALGAADSDEVGDGTGFFIGTNTNATSSKLFIEQSGNVGIGTTSPASKLHVAGTVQVGVDDTGHDVIFHGATSGKKLTWDESADGLYFADNTYLRLGDGGDVKMWHNGTDSYMMNLVGDLHLLQSANDKDIILSSDDGSGGTTAYLTLDGGLGRTTVQKNMQFADSAELWLGDGPDFKMLHDGSNTHLQQFGTGNLYIQQTTDDKDIIFQSDDGSGGVSTYFYLDGSEASSYLWTKFPDNSVISLGTSNDFTFWHNGTDTNFKNHTGDLIFTQNANDKDIIFQSDDGSGGVETYFYLDGSRSSGNPYTVFPDNSRLLFGDGGDLELFHNGSNSYLRSNTAFDIIIQQGGADKDIILQADNGSGSPTAYLTLDGSASQVLSSVTLKSTPPDANTHSLVLGRADTGNVWNVNHAGADFRLYNLADSGSNILLGVNSGSGVEANSVGIGVATPASLLHVAGTVQVGVDDTGHDVKFYGDASGEYMQWDTSEAKLKIVHTDEAVGLEVYTNASAQTTEPQLKVGRNVNEWWGAYCTDRTAHLVHRQDETSGSPNTSFEIWDSNTTDSAAYWVWRHANGSGGSLTEKMRLTKAGVLSVAELDISGNIDIDGITNLDAVDIDGAVQIDNTLTVGVDDTGHDVKFFGATSGKYMLWDESDDRLWLTDNTQLELGTGGDLQMLHNGSASFIQNYGGDLKIINNANDKDIIFQSDDGSGGVETYFFLDGSANTSGSPKTIFPDNSHLALGNSGDFFMYHDGTDTILDNLTGNITIQNKSDDKDIIFQCDDGSGGTTAYLTLDGSAQEILLHEGVKVEDYLTILDTKVLYVGSGLDLRIHHNGSDSYISQEGTGSLIIRNTTNDEDIIFQSDDGSGGVETYFYLDGSASSGEPYTVWPDSSIASWGSSSDFRIKHDGNHAYLYNTTGDIKIINYADDEDIVFQSDDGSGGVATYFSLDGSSATHDGSATTALITRFPDNSKIYLGTGDDGRLYHNGTDTYLQNTTGDLIIQNFADDKDVVFKCDDGAGGTATYFQLDGSHTETVFSESARFDDSKEARFGVSSDLKIYHNGSNSYIQQQGTGSLYIMNTTNDKDIIFISDDGSGGTTAYLTLDGGDGHTVANKEIQFLDSVVARFGSGNDMAIRHTGSHSYVSHDGTGNLYIDNTADDAETIFRCDDGSGGTTAYLTLDGRNEEVVFSKPIVTAETQIKVLPHQFMSNEDGGANKSVQFRDDTIIGVRTTADDAELYAFVEIPYGKTATNVTVYGNDASLVVNVYESDVNAGALTDKTPGGGCVVGDACDITDVAYSATNYLVIKVTTVSYTNDIVYGAVVTIT